MSSIDAAAQPARASVRGAGERIAPRRAGRDSRRGAAAVAIGILASIHSPVHTMSTLQLHYREDELLADHDVAEPLFAGGVRCHGGFTDEGTYVSPRTKHRVPATKAWQQ